MRAVSLSICAALFAAPAAAQSTEAGIDWPNAKTIEVDMRSFGFDPAILLLQQGVPYRLHFVNQSSGGHDFTAKEFFAQAAIDPEDQASVRGGVVSLDGGQSIDVRLVASHSGRYAARCSHMMHAMMGMKGQIVVQ